MTLKMILKLATEINRALREQDGTVVSVDRINEHTRYHVLLAGAIPFHMLFKSSIKTYSSKQAKKDWEEYHDSLYHKYLTLIRNNRLFLSPKPELDTEATIAFELEVHESAWSLRCQTMHVPSYLFVECEDFPHEQLPLAIGV